MFLSPLPFALSLIFLGVIPPLAIMPPSSDHFTPQIFPIYLRVLRCVLHYAKPGKCLLQTTEDAKVKQVFKLCSGFQSSSIWRVPTDVVGQRPLEVPQEGNLFHAVSHLYLTSYILEWPF